MEYTKKQERVVDFLRRGETEASHFQIGLEIEHIVVDGETLKTVNYYEDKGIETILKEMLPAGYEPLWEAERLVGLCHADYLITLEPGGQMEISIKPCSDLEESYRHYWCFLDDILPILNRNRQWLLCLGYHPQSSIHDLPFNPKQRYRFMSEYLGKTGRFAHNMMKGTASLQVVIDYGHQADFIEKMRVAHFLMPFLALVSDNAPFFEGKPVEQFSIRTAVWDETDPARCALIPGVMDQDFGYRAYADYILETPPILIRQENGFKGTGNLPVKELAGLEQFSDQEIDHLLSMVFPDVRVRRYIEIRMADSLPLPLSFAFAALIKNLFYNEPALRYLYRLSLGVDDEKLLQTRREMQKLGYDIRCCGMNGQQFLLMLLDLAKQNGTARENAWMGYLEEMVNRKETPAMISRRLVANRGIRALEWCAAHRWEKEAVL